MHASGARRWSVEVSDSGAATLLVLARDRFAPEALSSVPRLVGGVLKASDLARAGTEGVDWEGWWEAVRGDPAADGPALAASFLPVGALSDAVDRLRAWDAGLEDWDRAAAYEVIREQVGLGAEPDRLELRCFAVPLEEPFVLQVSAGAYLTDTALFGDARRLREMLARHVEER